MKKENLKKEKGVKEKSERSLTPEQVVEKDLKDSEKVYEQR